VGVKKSTCISKIKETGILWTYIEKRGDCLEKEIIARVKYPGG